jgi:hypothetical protein
MTDIFHKIETSFKASLRGEENVNNLIYLWGVISYLIAFLVFNKAIRFFHSYYVGAVLSVIAICYFAWHIYALKKCSPKKIKLSKEEKEKIREENKDTVSKSIARKLFLQEPITKWNPVFVTMVIDVFCIAQFLGYILK